MSQPSAVLLIALLLWISSFDDGHGQSVDASLSSYYTSPTTEAKSTAFALLPGPLSVNNPPRITSGIYSTKNRQHPIRVGESLILYVNAYDPDGDPIYYRWWHYAEPDSTYEPFGNYQPISRWSTTNTLDWQAWDIGYNMIMVEISDRNHNKNWDDFEETGYFVYSYEDYENYLAELDESGGITRTYGFQEPSPVGRVITIERMLNRQAIESGRF